MDDFNVSSLHESKNEWAARLVTILTPLIILGFKTILDEAIHTCKQNKENFKYLNSFQVLIHKIPNWNTQTIEKERKLICEKSGCNYLEDLVTCVHIIQLKILTSMRVGQKQKKIDINIPSLDTFIHKTYINAARKIYKNVYLFDVTVVPLQIQKNYRELEILVQECILNTLRESIPVEAILMAYMNETIEEDVVQEISEQIVEEPIKQKQDPNKQDPNKQDPNKQDPNKQDPNKQDPNKQDPNKQDQPNKLEQPQNKLTFNDIDYVKTTDGHISNVVAPKSISHLEELSEMRRNLEEVDDDNVKLNISNQPFNLDSTDIQNMEMDSLPDLLLDEIEILD
jgi:hypothetical protein